MAHLGVDLGTPGRLVAVGLGGADTGVRVTTLVRSGLLRLLSGGELHISEGESERERTVGGGVGR